MKVVLISSSTRLGRNSHRVTLMLQDKLVRRNHTVEVVDLGGLDIQLFKERFMDMDDPAPLYVKINESIQSADGIIMITPEYNSSITPALKNLIDIYGRQGFGQKPLAVATVSSGVRGGIVAAHHLQQIILSIDGQLFPKILPTAKVTEVINKDGSITDLEYLKIAEAYITRFISFTKSTLCTTESLVKKCS